MAKKSRVTTRKWMGDDLYSWAVFVDGQVKWNGLSRSEASYYAKLERERINE